jgi:hypothetical protein
LAALPAATYLKERAKAERSCLDKIAKGTLTGDADALCRGRFDGNSAIAPFDEKTAKKLAKAEEKLREKIADKCAGGELAALQSCGADPMSAGDCLACTHWRRGVAAIQSAYGP